jgi:hypothetical protein
MNIRESPNTILGPMAQRACAAIFSIGFVPAAFTQTALTWQQVKEKFELSNPTLKAAQANIDDHGHPDHRLSSEPRIYADDGPESAHATNPP